MQILFLLLCTTAALLTASPSPSSRGRLRDGRLEALQRIRRIREGRIKVRVNEESRARGRVLLESLQREEENREEVREEGGGRQRLAEARSLGEEGERREEGRQLRRKLRRRQRLRSTTERSEVTPQLQVMLL